MNLTPRQLRIKALQEELRTLLDEEAQEACRNLEALKQECQTLLKQGKKSEAVMLYRSKTGLTLREAYQALNVGYV